MKKKNKIKINNYMKLLFVIILGIFFIIFIGFIVNYYLNFYTNDYKTIESTITSIEQYEYKESQKHYTGIKIEYSYSVDEKEYKYVYKGELTDKVYNVGDSKEIFYSQKNPENVLLYRISPIYVLILIVLFIFIILIYFKFVKNKKNSILYIIFIICIFANLSYMYNIKDALYIKINYQTTDAFVDRTYTYLVEEYCTASAGKTCTYVETGALYQYEVNNNYYKASQLDVSSKTQPGDKKTIYYYPENPIYFSFGVNNNLIYSVYSILVFTSLAIITNPFIDFKLSKKKKKIL